jgi:hypothetical protein
MFMTKGFQHKNFLKFNHSYTSKSRLDIWKHLLAESTKYKHKYHKILGIILVDELRRQFFLVYLCVLYS